LNKKEIVRRVLENNGGIAKTADFVKEGLKNYELSVLCKEGFIERIQRGVYQFPHSNQITEEQLIQELLPQGIVCVETALFHYGYCDFAPRKWSVAVPRTAFRSIKKMGSFPIKAYYIQKQYFQIGKITDNFNGTTLAVYDRERTICDCFKYRTKLDSETFNKAINAYAQEKNKNLERLSQYAKEMKLYNKIMNVMEVLLNG
jgi:predicted transcriptional regulator of viral defense system